MPARIYQPARSAMQSGSAKTRSWVLEYTPQSALNIDPLMGWTSSNDTQSQVRLRFDSRAAAQSYAAANGIEVTASAPKPRKHVVRPNGYAENFANDRKTIWTH